LSYLEDLGCAASNGAVVFARQQLSNFIGREGGRAGQYVAYPAWWVAVLWKQLVGTVSRLTLAVDCLAASLCLAVCRAVFLTMNDS
jgi:hypothetical protein